MAKPILKKRVNKKKINDTTHKFFLGLTFMIFFALLLFPSPQDGLILITGMAIGEELNEMQPKSVLIYPSEGNVIVGNEIGFEIAANPFLEDTPEHMQKLNNFYAEISYDKDIIEYTSLEERILNYGFEIIEEVKDEDENLGLLKINAYGHNPVEDLYYFEPIVLFELKFLAKTSTASASSAITFELFNIENSFNPDRTEALLINELNSASVIVAPKSSPVDDDDGSSNDGSVNTGDTYHPQMAHSDTDSPFENITNVQTAGICMSNCVGKECGSDGCDGFCGDLNGECPDLKQCINYKCVCVPNCAEKTCGDDGCGGLCNDLECDPVIMKPKSIWSWWLIALLLIFLIILIALLTYLLLSHYKKKKTKKKHSKTK
ncbi:hypothetical protein HN695_03315 [Candidatus Woesearchaeota archaeon]|jgi:hypothetical protein|nr:hypothetical protein [Candidatus Woesearchaeota archaeon]MBT5272014.1 hypothetical protein [Candidatus Woesearchaeota archaeon]MBT6040755.1 hypothetical protein [Candidatus Woesearchaeota archaeon]MBT6336707.1 hypothetical protein [Candidatus Woesearchaeota archaeon]MBT7927340.1 hypothetical protein [Candidatus Woesearchaeota archaeon]